MVAARDLLCHRSTSWACFGAIEACVGELLANTLPLIFGARLMAPRVRVAVVMAEIDGAVRAVHLRHDLAILVDFRRDEDMAPWASPQPRIGANLRKSLKSLEDLWGQPLL
jgi:hypothetical protein